MSDNTLPVTHNPRSKRDLKNGIISTLYEPFTRQRDKLLENILRKNAVIVHSDHLSVVYKGTYYSVEKTHGPLRANRLDKSLRTEMDAYLSATHYVEEIEIPRVKGFINQVLNATDGIPDLLVVFPDVVHSPINQFICKCPCHNAQLNPEQLEVLRQANTDAIDLIKQRMVRNLLV